MREVTVVEAEIRHLERQIQRLEQAQLDPDAFKKLRLQYGIYSMRRAPTSYMIRVKIPLGILTPGQLDELAAVCEQWTPARACHLTTRQAVQLYGVERGQLPALLRRLAAAGLTTREASGNVVRNVTCCPWAGVAPGEPFNITPYAQQVGDYLLRNPLTQILPRKVKIAFEGCAGDHARTVIHDIGVVAALQGDQRGFRIYAGGGLGPTPRAGRLIEPWTSVEWLLPTMEAILRVFDRHGERRNRARARLKFLVEQLGWEAFRQLVLEERQLVWATQSGRALQLPEAGGEEPAMLVDFALARVPETDREPFARWVATNTASQKQEDVVSVVIRVPYGDIRADQLRGIGSLARRYANGIRCMNTQNLLLRFVPYAALPIVYDELRRLQLAGPWAGRLADVTRCPGADTCLSAVTHPRGLAEALEASFQNGLGAWAGAPVSIKISGCPNSCGQHHIADIGLFGVAVKVGEQHLPCYQLLVGGRTAEGQAQFGQRCARIPAQRAPDAIKRLIKLYADQHRDGETFHAFIERVGLEPLQTAVGDLADLTDAAAHAELFTDLGDTEPFELAAGKGECAE